MHFKEEVEGLKRRVQHVPDVSDFYSCSNFSEPRHSIGNISGITKAISERYEHEGYSYFTDVSHSQPSSLTFGPSLECEPQTS